MEVDRNPLERDLQQHLVEIIEQVDRMPGKVSTIVEESVKYLQNVDSKKAGNVREEVELVMQVLEDMKGQMIKSTLPVEMMERMAALETGLADCTPLTEAVTDRGERMEDRLDRLLHKLDMVASISDKMGVKSPPSSGT